LPAQSASVRQVPQRPSLQSGVSGGQSASLRHSMQVPPWQSGPCDEVAHSPLPAQGVAQSPLMQASSPGQSVSAAHSGTVPQVQPPPWSVQASPAGHSPLHCKSTKSPQAMRMHVPVPTSHVSPGLQWASVEHFTHLLALLQ
jgi:hypothetical protein